MPRTVSNTTLAIGPLVIPVALRKITDRKDVKIDRASKYGNPCKQQMVDGETFEVLSGPTVDDAEAEENFIHGVWDGEPDKGGEFRPIPSEAIEAIKAATKLDTLNIDHFVPLSEVPWERTMDAYYLAPQRGSASGRSLALLLRALQGQTKGKRVIREPRAGVFKMVLRSRQYLAVVYPKGDGLFVNTLCFAHDFAQADEAATSLEGVAVNEAHLSVALDLVEAMTAPADVIDTYEDDLIPLKAALVEQALAGQAVQPTKTAAKVAVPTGPDAIMAALTASLAAAQAKGKPARAKTKAEKQIEAEVAEGAMH
jgi:DNA end-binding protein Ku